jgi:hypothetical protein
MEEAPLTGLPARQIFFPTHHSTLKPGWKTSSHRWNQTRTIVSLRLLPMRQLPMRLRQANSDLKAHCAWMAMLPAFFAR